MPITFDATRNKKQQKFFEDFWMAIGRYERGQVWKKAHALWVAAGSKPELDPGPMPVDDEAFRIWCYGGAVQGGKTFVCLAILVLLCKKYRGSRWHVIRATMPDLERTVQESMIELLGRSKIRWKRGRAEWYLLFPNGSRIYFMAANFRSDRDLNRFKGLQTNGFLLEQVEELPYELLEKCIERGSRHKIEGDIQPPPMILMTFNPTYTWVKEKVFDAWERGDLKVPYYFMQALPEDSPFPSEEQWALWKQLDPATYDRFINGIWDIDVKGRFAYAFKRQQHVSPVPLVHDPQYPIYLQFDFNVDPMCATVAQTDGKTWRRVLCEYRLENSDTWRICEAIKAEWWPDDPEEAPPEAYVCGDASGRQRLSGVRGALSQYHIIQQVLGIPWERFLVPKVNPFIVDSRVLMNTAISRLDYKVDPSCVWLIHDLMFVKVKLNQEGQIAIQKTGKLAHAKLGAESMGHLMDTERYGMHMTLPFLVELVKEIAS